MSKSYMMARWFWRAGYKVVLVETDKYWLSGARWSRAVTAFETVPCPRIDPKGYVDGLVRVADKYRARFFVPVSSPVSSVSDSAAKPGLEAVGCRVLHFDLGMCEQLDNKHDFCQLAKQLGLTSPESFHVPDEATARQLNNDLQSAGHSPMTPRGTQFILKNLQYDPVHRLDMFKLPCETSKLDAYLSRLRADGTQITPEQPWQLQQFIQGTG